MDAFCLCIVIYIINLLTRACTLKTCHWTVMFMFYFEESCHCFQASSFLITLFLCMRHHQLDNVEGTHQPLMAIPFKTRVNNCSKSLPLPAYEKNFVEFSFLCIFKSSIRLFISRSCNTLFFIMKCHSSCKYSLPDEWLLFTYSNWHVHKHDRRSSADIYFCRLCHSCLLSSYFKVVLCNRR